MCWNQSSLPEQASQFTVPAVGLDVLPTLPMLTAVHKHSMEWFARVGLSVCDLCCAVFAGPPLTQSSLINSREQPGTSAVPSLAPVGARLPPPLPQNLLYTVSERKQMPFGFKLCDGKNDIFSVDVRLEIMICRLPIYTNLKRSLMALPFWNGLAAVLCPALRTSTLGNSGFHVLTAIPLLHKKCSFHLQDIL